MVALSEEARLPELTPDGQRRGMRTAIAAQCFGVVGMLAFSNGLFLL